MNNIAKPTEIKRALSAILRPGQVTEVRALDATIGGDRYPQTISGYFNDVDKIAAAAATIQTAKAVFFIPNPVHEGLLARAVNRIRPAKKEPTTSDGDVVRRYWLLVDADAQRPSGISASDGEHAAALERAAYIAADLKLSGWPAPIYGDSGNGGHLMFPIDLPAEDDGLVSACLEALHALYGDDVVKVDTSVFNPARPWKLYGTVAGKGDDAAECGRPHRMAKVVDIPETLSAVPRELLDELAARAPSRAKPAGADGRQVRRAHGNAFNVADWIRDNRLDVRGPEDWNPKGGGRGRRWVFNVCPWNDAHTNGSAYILEFPSGAVEAGCHHDGCSGRDWQSLRDLYEPLRHRHTDRVNGNGKAKPTNVNAQAAAASPPAAKREPSPVVTCLADVEPEQVRWLCPGVIARGKLNLVCGDPGVGKSTLTLYMAATVSTGSPWMVDPFHASERGAVILVSAEDGLADTVRPRLDAAGADVRRVVALQGSAFTTEDGREVFRGFTLRDLPTLEGTLRQTQGVALIVIDPVSAYLADSDSHKNAEIRGLLAPLAKLAEQYDVAVVMVTHLTKGEAQRAMYRAMGSLAFIAAARTGWLVAEDKSDPQRRLFLPIKNNLAPTELGYAYRVIDGAVRWDREPVRIRADEALGDAGEEDARPGPAPVAKAAATEWLRELLSGGSMPVAKIQEESKAAGMSFTGAVRRAKEALGIVPFKGEFGGGWYWKLPPEPAPEGAQDAADTSVTMHPTQTTCSSSGEPAHLRVFGPEDGDETPPDAGLADDACSSSDVSLPDNDLHATAAQGEQVVAAVVMHMGASVVKEPLPVEVSAAFDRWDDFTAQPRKGGQGRTSARTAKQDAENVPAVRQRAANGTSQKFTSAAHEVSSHRLTPVAPEFPEEQGLTGDAVSDGARTAEQNAERLTPATGR